MLRDYAALILRFERGEWGGVAGIVTLRALTGQSLNPDWDNRWSLRSWGKPEISQRHEMFQSCRISVPAVWPIQRPSSLYSGRGVILTIHLHPVQRLRMSGAKGAQIFPKFGRHLKIIDARRVTWSEFHTEYPQIVGATLQNLVSLQIWWCPGFVHPWVELYLQSLRDYHKDSCVFCPLKKQKNKSTLVV